MTIQNDDMPVEGVDYIIEDEDPSGPPCPDCGSRQEKNHEGVLFCAECIAAYYDRYACQDASLNMRISSAFLEKIKNVAISQGFHQYQTWITMTLEAAVAEHESQGTV